MVPELINTVIKILHDNNIKTENLRALPLNRSYGDYVYLSFLMFDVRNRYPIAVAKLDTSLMKTSILQLEFNNLKTMHSAAPNPKFKESIPLPFYLGQWKNYSLLIESALPGKRMKNYYPQTYLRSQLFKTHLNAVVSWLLDFHNCQDIQNINIDKNNNLLQENIAKYLKSFDYSDKLKGLLEETKTKLYGINTKLVAWHRDFCTANVLVNDYGYMGVIDWEYPLDKLSWPLADLLYFISSLQSIRFKPGLEALEHNYRSLYFRNSTLNKLLKDIIYKYAKYMNINMDLLVYYSVISWVMYANHKYEYLGLNGIDMGSEDVVIHLPLIMIREGRCMNLEILAELERDYIFSPTMR
jgi:hypothetical protein